MWPKSKPYVLVAPAVIVIALLFLGGLWEGLIQSLGYFSAAGQEEWTLKAYRTLWGSEDFWRSLGLTFRIALISTGLAAILGLLMALALHALERRSRFQAVFWQRVMLLPMLIPHFVGAYLIVLLFTQSGWVARMSVALGLLKDMDDFPVWVNDPWGWGIILTYTWKEAPFIAWMLVPVLRRIGKEWRQVSRVFGAGVWRYAREILLPLLLPAWLTASFIVFAYTFSAFEVPYLLGVTYPKLLPVYSYELYTSGNWEQRPEALAVTILLAGITALLGWIAFYMGRRLRMGEGGRW